MGKSKVKTEEPKVVQEPDITDVINEHFPELWLFTNEMARKLNKHREQKSNNWKIDSPETLLERLKEEVEELERVLRSIRNLPAIAKNPTVEKVLMEAVRHEAADVGNFAMMIADVAGNLMEEDK